MQNRILLVDDEPSLRRTLSIGLNQEGYDVEPCENGIHALQKLFLYKKNQINLETVILDIKLPDIDGIKLGKIIQSNYPGMNIIYITGYSDKINMQEIQNLDTSGFLEKPFTASDLTLKIEELIKNKNISTQTITAAIQEATKSYSSYALLKIDQKANIFDVYRKLYFNKHVVYCDATQGEYDIFLLIQADNPDKCKLYREEINQNIKGIAEIEFLEISRPVLDESLYNAIRNSEDLISEEQDNIEKPEVHDRLSSYILLQIEREKIENIYPVLCLDENVAYCDYTLGAYNLVLLVYGTSYEKIDKFIENKLSNIDGILKIKEFPIVKLFEM